MSQSTPATVVFAGGGTGGHIFPGLAITEQLRTMRPSLRFCFLISQRPLDAEVLEPFRSPDLEVRPVSAKPFGLSPRTLWELITNWGQSVRESRAILREVRRTGPLVVVAMGGFVAVPVVQAARVEHIPSVLINLDAVPGKANRWMGRHVARVLSTTELAPGQNRPDWKVIAPIVRSQAIPTLPPPRCRERFGLDPAAPTLFVSGGSQGAGSINALLRGLANSPDWPRGWQVIHQTGRGQTNATHAAYEAAGIPAWVGEFITNIGDAWGAADLALARAGANTVAEAWASRTPTIFLPYPHHRDQHQAHNAARLVRVGGAVVAQDLIEPHANAATVGSLLLGLLHDHGRRAAMRQALRSLGPVNGASAAAQTILDALCLPASHTV
jgi:UDP-N-acetylglucosamine--N-acetylmuramyl-(pentapeptide) pyrophosphoryl-undecaprenol N-acetylglucosamine transferase